MPDSRSFALFLILSICGVACKDSGRQEVIDHNRHANSNATNPAVPTPASTDRTVASQTPRPANGNGGEITVSTFELSAAYSNDAKAADKLYKGRRLAVSGSVESVLLSGPPPVGPLKGLSGKTVMFFQGQSIACVFEPGQKASAAQLQSGDRVIVICNVVGRNGERVVLKKCFVKESGSRKVAI
jgi:hypothetical protein